MTTSAIRTTTETAYKTTSRHLQDLRGRLAGELVTASSTGYEEARQLANIRFDRRPFAIVRAASTADVAEAVRFVREHDYALSIRSGGHSLAGHGAIDGALVIDLSAMKAVSIDSARQSAHVQAGATSGDVTGPAHAYGFALTTGDTASVGLGGLVTGGGIGWLARKYGLTIDNLLSATVVTADGEVVTASQTQHPDLFWALRGGGGNFGVVTEFEFKLAPVAQIYGGVIAIPATREVVRGYLDYVATAPEDLTTITNLMLAPPAPFVPEERIGELILLIQVVWTGSVADGDRALQPLRALGEAMADTVASIPYPVIYEYTAMAAQPHGAFIRSYFANEISDHSIDAWLEAMRNATSPVCMIQLRGLGGAIAEVASEETAFAHRDKDYLVAVLGLWLDPTDYPAPHRDWVESLWAQVQPEADGVYVNFLGEEGDQRVREAYAASTTARLAEVKAKYDPTNLFRFNQNIRPRA